MSNTAELNALVNTSDGPEWCDIAVEYSVDGCYIPATYHEPEETPTVDIEAIFDSMGKVIDLATLGVGQISKIQEMILEIEDDRKRDEREVARNGGY